MYSTDMESNQALMIRWFEEYSNISQQEYSIFLNILNDIQGDMTAFYNMNEVLEDKRAECIYTNNKFNLRFMVQDKVYVLESTYGNITLDYYAYKSILSKIVDIYSITYPLGTVVELNKEDFKGIIPEDAEGPFRVVILDRFTPFTENLYFYYSGMIYPIGNDGAQITAIRFAPSAIKKVIHMGFSDEKDVAYIRNEKVELLFNKGMHSTSIMTSEELGLFQLN